MGAKAREMAGRVNRYDTASKISMLKNIKKDFQKTKDWKLHDLAIDINSYDNKIRIIHKLVSRGKIEEKE